MTPNLLTALSGGVGNARGQGSEYADYAVSVENGDTSCIIYIKDTQAELQEVNWMLFTIILQALFVGLIIALTLSFFSGARDFAAACEADGGSPARGRGRFS